MLEYEQIPLLKHTNYWQFKLYAFADRDIYSEELAYMFHGNDFIYTAQDFFHQVSVSISIANQDIGS